MLRIEEGKPCAAITYALQRKHEVMENSIPVFTYEYLLVLMNVCIHVSGSQFPRSKRANAYWRAHQRQYKKSSENSFKKLKNALSIVGQR